VEVGERGMVGVRRAVVAFRDPLLRYGALLLVAHLGWRAVIATDSYFWQDDFRLLAAVRDGLSPNEVVPATDVYLRPGSLALAWAIAPAGADHRPAAVSLVVGYVVCGVLMLWLLRLLFPQRRAPLVGYAVYLFSPLGLVGATWWAYGVQALPTQAAGLGVAVCYLEFRRSRRRRWVAFGLVGFVAALTFHEMALGAPWVTLGLAMMLLDRELSWRERCRSVRTDAAFWVPFAVVSLMSVAVLVVTGAVRPGVGASAVESPWRYGYDAVLGTLVPGLLGGPWTGDGAAGAALAVPPVGVVITCAALWVVVIIITIRRRGRVAVRAWTFAGGYLVVLLAVTLWHRADVANLLVRDARFLVDSVPVIVVAVLAAMLPVHAPSSSRWPIDAEPSTIERVGADGAPRVRADGDRPMDPAPVVVVAAVAVVLMSSGISTDTSLDRLQHAYSRHYVLALVRALEDEPDAQVVDASAPPVDVAPRPVSEVVHAVGADAGFDLPSTDLRIVDGFGRLAPVDLLQMEATARGPTPGCGWLVESSGSPLDIRLGVSRPGLRIVRIRYVAQRRTVLEVRVDQSTSVIATQAPFGQVDIVTRDGADRVGVRVRGTGDEVCVTEVQAGPPWPAPMP
jgi:hypothetical protein